MNKKEIDEIVSGLAPEPMSLYHQALSDAATLLAPAGQGRFEAYKDDPVGYARDVLKAKFLSSMQEDVLRLCAQPPDDEWHCKLAIGAGASVGKTWLGAVIVNWMYDCRGPCICLTTAPSQQSVVDLLWKEIRMQRIKADSKWNIGNHDFIGPQAPAMRRGPDWLAKGIVAAKAETWKGRHPERMVFLFDEAVGIPDLYFQGTKNGMFKPDGKMLWICLYNPTDTSSPMYQQIKHPESDWVVVELSSLDHPNIEAALKGEPPPIPTAVTIDQLKAGIAEDCERIPLDEKVESDIEWPPGSGIWYRPGRHFEWAFLGRWPTGDADALWSDALWKSITKPLHWADIGTGGMSPIAPEEIPRIGCDAATKGADKTDIHVSWGDYSVFHQSKGKSKPMATCGRLIEIAEHWAEKCTEHRAKFGLPAITGKNVPIKIDDDGAGGVIGERLREQGYRIYAVGAATLAAKQNRYPNKRSELWFQTCDRARMGKLHMGLLPRKTLEELNRQAIAPTWDTNSAGQRVIEEKDRMRDRLGRSPDGMDAVNLSYYIYDWRWPEIIKVESQGFMERVQQNKEERALDRESPRGGWKNRGGDGRRRGLFRRQ